MSGHSKWANIKRQKQAADLARGNIFSKLTRAITLAILEGRGVTDPEHNFKLRLAIDRARETNMPKENIKRAIERGVGPGKEQLREVIFEAFAPHGVALMIVATTDNLNRTLSEVRNVLEKGGGKLATQGAVNYLFKKCAEVTIKKDQTSEEEIFSIGEKLEATDIDEDESNFFIYIPFENLSKIKDYTGKINYKVDIDYRPSSYIKIEDKAVVNKILILITALENLEDIHRVFANAIWDS